MLATLIAIFCAGYLLIALEHKIGINKSAVALLMCGALWAIFSLAGHDPQIGAQLTAQLGSTCEILVYLIGAMTIVDLIDTHGGFNVITSRIRTRSKRRLLWLLVVITFFMSAVLDNMTTAIIMIMLLRRIIDDRRERWIFAALIVGALGGAVFGWNRRKVTAEREIKSAEDEATRIVNEAYKSAESKKREALVEAKEEILKAKNEHEKEVKDRRSELQRQENRLQQKEENLDRKTENIEKKEEQLSARLAKLDATQAEAEALKQKQVDELERISGFTAEEAKNYLLKQLEEDVTHESAMKIKEIEARFKDEADTKAREIISLAIQRCASDHVAEATVSVVALPSDDMKGRIIGREGRNIRTLETLTGVDLIIDDTPEAITVSCFDPVRREIARIAPEKLIQGIADLTGWDLTLAEEVTSGKGGMSVCLADTSSLFIGPPSPQKDEFHMYDAEQLAETILDSIQKTLQEGLP